MPTNISDKNLFAYSDNNPIIRADDGGEIWHVFAGAIGTLEIVSQSVFNIANFAGNRGRG